MDHPSLILTEKRLDERAVSFSVGVYQSQPSLESATIDSSSSVVVFLIFMPPKLPHSVVYLLLKRAEQSKTIPSVEEFPQWKDCQSIDGCEKRDTNILLVSICDLGSMESLDCTCFRFTCSFVE